MKEAATNEDVILYTIRAKQYLAMGSVQNEAHLLSSKKKAKITKNFGAILV